MHRLYSTWRRSEDPEPWSGRSLVVFAEDSEVPISSVISFLTSFLGETSGGASEFWAPSRKLSLSRSCTDMYYACMYFDREIYLRTEPTRLHHSPHAEYLLLSLTPLLAKIERDISVLDHMSVLSATSRRYGWNSLLDLPAHCQTE